MKSNSWHDASAWAVILVGVGLIFGVRSSLAEDFKRVKDRSDAYLLPSVDQSYLMSLGYRSAMADLIFGHVLVASGLHIQDKRLFEYVGDYLDVINRLDPKFRDPYHLADTLLTLQAEAPPVDFYRKARQIQERGLKELPFDQQLWSTAGQFITYLAAGRLSDPAEKREYQEAGTRYLIRACELIGSNENVPYHCITAATLLSREGKQAALVSFLERIQQVSDDPKIQAMAAAYLVRNAGESAQAQLAARTERYRSKWHQDLPLAPRVEIGALGPGFEPAACAGVGRPFTSECATSWSLWSETSDDPPGR